MSDGRLRVALTIDVEHGDRPHSAGGAARLLAVLDRRGATATFFLQGRWVTAEPSVAQQIAAGGHTIGNHSHSHVRMPQLSDAGLTAEVTEASEAITAATGVDPAPWFRCPYGDGHDDPRVLAGLQRLGYRDVYWHVDPRDWEPGRTAAEVVSDVVAGVAAHGDGCVVVLHSWPDVTVASLPGVLDGLELLGAEFTGLEEVCAA